jgi:putative flippase GtrA
LVAGFFLHSHFSFAGHGTRENSGRQHAKFVTVHCVGLAMNMLLTWALTAGLNAPEWAPLLPSVTLTPLVTFLLQRQWVFA